MADDEYRAIVWKIAAPANTVRFGLCQVFCLITETLINFNKNLVTLHFHADYA